jgi:hypothetical protein
MAAFVAEIGAQPISPSLIEQLAAHGPHDDASLRKAVPHLGDLGIALMNVRRISTLALNGEKTRTIKIEVTSLQVAVNMHLANPNALLSMTANVLLVEDTERKCCSISYLIPSTLLVGDNEATSITSLKELDVSVERLVRLGCVGKKP